MFGRNRINPTIVKIKGAADDVAFLDHCITELISGCTLRRTWRGLSHVPAVDDDGCNEIAVLSPSDLRVIDIMAGQLNVQIVSIAYPGDLIDQRPPNKCEFTYQITYKGRSATFDLSVR